LYFDIQALFVKKSMQLWIKSADIPALVLEFIRLHFEQIWGEYYNHSKSTTGWSDDLRVPINRCCAQDHNSDDNFIDKIFDLENQDILKNSSESAERWVASLSTEKEYFKLRLQGVFAFAWFAKSELQHPKTEFMQVMDGFLSSPVVIDFEKVAAEFSHIFIPCVIDYVLRYILLKAQLKSDLPARCKSLDSSATKDEIQELFKSLYEEQSALQGSDQRVFGYSGVICLLEFIGHK
jgi:hypothetical protein